MIASRLNNIEDSITLSLSAKAAELRKAGHDIIGFGAGEPDFDTPVAICDAAVAAIRSGKTRYTATSGILELRVAIATYLKSVHALSYTPNEIIVCAGAKHAIYNIMMAMINPGDEVIIPAPYWVSYPDQVRLAGGVPVIITTTEENQFQLTAEQLQRAITPKTKLVIINSPSNPTGQVLSRDVLTELANVIVANDLWVISDEIYEQLIYGDQTHTSIASLGTPIFNRTIVVNGVSKSYAMTGWRIGYAAGPRPIIDAIGKIQSHSTSNSTTVAQYAALAAYQGSQAPINEMRKAFDSRRREMVDLLNQIPGIHCIEPLGAFYAFPNITGLFGKESPSGPINDSDSFCERLLEDVGVSVVPGSGFGQNGYIRLSYATSSELIRAGIARIAQWVQALQ